MRKLILMSVLVATFWIPIAAAREENPLRALRKMKKRWYIFCAIYVISILYVIPRL
jgi:hypothetical protein